MEEAFNTAGQEIEKALGGVMGDLSNRSGPFCPKCGKRNPLGAGFCVSCGERISSLS